MTHEAEDAVALIHDFGRDAAEQESIGNHLIQHFIQNEAYIKAAEASKTLIIGRKGSGKSAIFLFLKYNLDKFENIRMAFLVPDDVSAKRLKDFTGHGINDQVSKILAWRYVLLVVIAKFVVETAEKWGEEKYWPEPARKVRKFLVENNETEDLSATEKISKIASKIKTGEFTIKIAAVGELGIKRQNDADGFALSDSIDRVENLLLKTIETSLFSQLKFHIYIDQVDDVWSNDLASNQLVIGLIQAANRINITFPVIKVVILLRTDIYQVLEFHEKDKLRGSELEILWNFDSLSNLILERTRRFIDVNSNNFVKTIFNGQLENNDLLSYMISRTLLRPRELIQFCNESLDIAKRSKNNKILADNVLEAEERFSKWKVSDLVAEYSTNYPFLNDLIIIFAKHVGFTRPTFTRNEFSTKYDSVKDNLTARNREISEITPEILLAILYNIGFIGVIRSESISYKHTDPNTINDFDSDFTIHPAFWKSLAIHPVNQQDHNPSTSKNVNTSTTQPEPPDLPADAERIQDTQSRDNTKPSPSTQTNSTKRTARVIAGSDEVQTSTYSSDFRKVSQKIAKIYASMRSMVSRFDTGKALLVRTIATLMHADKQLKEIDQKIAEAVKSRDFPEDRTWVVRRYGQPLAHVCYTIETAISTLEKAGSEYSFFSKQNTNELANLLLDFYNTLINDYEFDMMLLTNLDQVADEE